MRAFFVLLASVLWGVVQQVALVHNVIKGYHVNPVLKLQSSKTVYKFIRIRDLLWSEKSGLPNNPAVILKLVRNTSQPIRLPRLSNKFPSLPNTLRKWRKTFIQRCFTVGVRFKNSWLRHVESRRSNSVPGNQEEMWRYDNSTIFVVLTKGYTWKTRAYLEFGTS